MDVEDDWGDDTFFVLNDDDLNFSVTSSFKSHHDNTSDSSKNCISSKNEAFLKKIDEDLDYEFALSLQEQYDADLNGNPKKNSEDEAFLKKTDEDLDYQLALSFQDQYNEDLKEIPKASSKNAAADNSKPLSIVDEQWELIDPHPDVHALFLEYDSRFFYGKLKGVEVRWSPRMTLCAGVCSYEGRGGLCSIRLSLPLLKLRPRRDLVETLLHEMIHAYLFVTHNNRDRESHGPEFLSHMYRINKESGTKITVYHSFHDEVDLYRKHWWKCDGPCQKRHPFYGIVKRAMNRAPGPKDTWWSDHQASCGGKFVKIKEPDNYKKSGGKRKAYSDSKSEKSYSDIRSFLKNDIPKSVNNPSNHPTSESTRASRIITLESMHVAGDSVADSPTKVFVPFQGSGHKLGGSSKNTPISSYFSSESFKKLHSSNASETSSSSSSSALFLGSEKLSKTSISISAGKRIEASLVKSGPSSNDKTKLIQKPMDKYLSSKLGQNPPVSSKFQSGETNDSKPKSETNFNVKCPVCFILVKENEINSHLDVCLNSSSYIKLK